MEKRLIINYSSIFKFFFTLIFFKAVIGILISKLFITGLLILLILIIFINISFRVKLDKVNSLIIILLVILIINLIVSNYVNRDIIEFKYSIISFTQLAFPLFLLFVFYNISYITLIKVCRTVARLSFIFIIIGLVEFCIPGSIMKGILLRTNELINNEREILVSYYMGDFEINKYRLGSLFFEPLTFAFVSGAYFIWLLHKKWYVNLKNTVSGMVHFLSMGKMAIIISILSVGYGMIKKYSLVLYALIILTSIFLSYQLSTSDLKKSPSMGNHIIGLKNGINNTKDFFLTGHGLGTAGYNIYLLSKINNKTPFIKNKNNIIDPLKNGNESGVGIMVYQTGFVYTILYFYLMATFCLSLFRVKEYIIFGLFSGYLLSILLLESPLSIIITSIVFLYTFTTYKKHVFEI